MEALVSIVIDNYNHARYLRQAVESALCQSYANTEVIVVDDGSTDNSRDILTCYGAQIRTVLKHNGGQASAFNAGFACARGDLVMILDSDDVLLPHAAERAVELFRAHPEIGSAQFRLELIDAVGAHVGAFVPPLSVRVSSGNGYAVRMPGNTSMWPSTTGTTYARWLVSELLPIPEDTSRRLVCADGYARRAATLLAPFVVSNEVTACYRRHESNTDPFLGKSHLDSGAVRRELAHWMHMYWCLDAFASSRLGLCGGVAYERVRDGDVAFLSLRIAGQKLNAGALAWPESALASLAWRGILAASRCPDVSLAYRCRHVAWFAAVALAPSALARRLVEWKLYVRTAGV